MKTLLKSLVPARVKTLIKRLLQGPPRAGFIAAPSIDCQLFTFHYAGRTYQVGADHTTPLYETIAELVDFDAYQIGRFSQSQGSARAVVDIGGNVGVSSILLSTIPGAHVTSFEPMPGNCVQFRRNMERNGIQNVELVQAAIAAEDGDMLFAPHPSISVAGHLCPDHVPAPPGSFRIPAFSLDSLLTRLGTTGIFLMKIDCEGDEYGILERLTPSNVARIENMTLEVHDIDSRRNVRTLGAKLQQAGYELAHRPDLYGRAFLHHILASRR